MQYYKINIQNSHEQVFTPTEDDYVGIGFADLRFHLAIKYKVKTYENLTGKCSAKKMSTGMEIPSGN